MIHLLLLEHILLMWALPSAWEVPSKLWHVMQAILCWLIWKDRNQHIFGGGRSDVQHIIGLAWHRLTL